MQEPNRFVIKICLTTDRNGKTNEDYFEFTHLVSHINDTGVGAYFYDPESKMNFEDKSALGSIYQVDIETINIQPSKRLEKASDFIRRTNYVNDWMEVKINTQGIVKSVENREELVSSWKELKQILSNEYTGSAVEKYLTEIDERLNVQEKILRAAYTYLNFGLIFPHIPPKHGEDWENRRQVVLSEYENENVEEHTTYTETKNGMRRYDVTLSSTPEQQINITDSNGYIFIRQGEIFPEEAKVNVSYQNGPIHNTWEFKLERY